MMSAEDFDRAVDELVRRFAAENPEAYARAASMTADDLERMKSAALAYIQEMPEDPWVFVVMTHGDGFLLMPVSPLLASHLRYHSDDVNVSLVDLVERKGRRLKNAYQLHKSFDKLLNSVLKARKDPEVLSLTPVILDFWLNEILSAMRRVADNARKDE